MYNELLTVAGAVTALATILGAARGVARFAEKCTAFFRDTARTLRELQERQRELELAILRLTLIDDAMPASERLAAGKKYDALGGNGECRKLYLALKEIIDT